MRTRLGVDVDALERELREAVDGEVRFDDGTLAAYSTDASNYRQVPVGVVVPRTPDAAAAVSSDDSAGLREVRSAVQADVAAGEYARSPDARLSLSHCSAC